MRRRLVLLVAALIVVSPVREASANDVTVPPVGTEEGKADDVRLSSPSGASGGASSVTLIDGARFQLVNLRWELLPDQGGVLRDTMVATYEARSDAEVTTLAATCSVTISAQTPYRATVSFGNTNVFAYATFRVGDECAATEWRHEVFRNASRRGVTYRNTVSPGREDADLRIANCTAGSSGSWSNRVNGTIYASAFLPCV
jgi:hypothetical protein